MKAKDYNDYLNKKSWQELRAEARKQFARNKVVTIIAICAIAVLSLLTIGIMILI